MSKTREQIIAALDGEFDKGRVKQREGSRGMKLDYLETHDVIDTLNNIFGYDGWEDVIISHNSLGDVKAPRLFQAIVSLTVWFDDKSITKTGVGVGRVQGQNWTEDEAEKAVKEAESDALKRAARKLGRQFGNTLYDKYSDDHIGSKPQAAAPRAQSSGGDVPAPRYENRECPICSGDMWDNRATKTKPTQPDFKCKDRECKGVIWPPKNQGTGQLTEAAFSRLKDTAARVYEGHDSAEQLEILCDEQFNKRPENLTAGEAKQLYEVLLSIEKRQQEGDDHDPFADA